MYFQAVYNIRGSGNEVNSVLMRTTMTSQVHNTQQTPFQINLPFNQTKTARDPCVTRNTITITNTSFQLQILNYLYKYFFFLQMYDEPPPRPFHTFKFPHITVEVETTPQVCHNTYESIATVGES